MRMILALALAALLAAPALAQETPQRGGTLVFAVNAEPPSYDCQATTSFVATQTLNPHYSQLLRYDVERYPALRGDLAERWSVSADGLAYTFTLRPNVRFHDGGVLTSDDVKASIERIMRPPDGVIQVRQAQFEDIASIETPDPLTVVFRLRAANAAMLTVFASPTYCIYRAEHLRRDPRFPERNIVGTGPFRFIEHARGSHWVGRRFEQYFEDGYPLLDGFRIQFMAGAAMINALQGGQIMAEFRGLTPAERDRLTAALGNRVVTRDSPWICKMDLFFNTQRAPYSDVRVRRALSLAIDRWRGAEAMSRTAFVREVGLTQRPGHPFAMPRAELEQIPGFGRDIAAARAEARRLLREAGVENLRFRLLNRSVPMPYTPVAIYLIDQWRQIGLAVEHNQVELSQQKAAFVAGNFEVGLDANCYDADEPNALLALYLSHDRSPINFSHYIDRRLDELYEAQKRATDEAARARLIREFERHLMDRQYTVPVVWWHRTVIHDARIRGWAITPSHYLNQDLARVWLAQ
jgi:peptide/nickel transport system substrate-binding protein